MRKRLLAAVVTLSLVPAWTAYSQSAIYLVRHAEKVDNSEDPPLSEAGKARAQSLAKLLRDSGIKAIFSSSYQRNVNTARPLAQGLRIQPIIMHPHDFDGMMQHMRGEFAEDPVLIVGHSDTVPAMIKKLGHPQEITLDHGEYDNLFVLIPRPEGPPVFLRLRF
jgi:broad specificity phosphatase PhoE